jgi:lipid A disaccharide synthetase
VQIAIISGEASGDRVGAQLAREIRRLRPDWHLFGTGGKHLREAGVELLVDSSRWGVVGVAQGLALLPKILSASSDLKANLLRRKPSLIIPSTPVRSTSASPGYKVCVRGRVRNCRKHPSFITSPRAPGGVRETNVA